MRSIVVTGAAGFVGGHLVRAVRERYPSAQVRGVDLRRPEHGASEADEFLVADLRGRERCAEAVAGADVVFALAANMGGIGWTHAAPAQILHDNLLISVNTVEACRLAGVRTVVYTSSACVYPESLQRSPDSAPLRETPVFPAEPDMQYGWEKLTTEILCETYRRTYGMDVKVARLHAIYGPMGGYRGLRAKSLSMLCGKVAAVPGDRGEVEVWGDGSQTRSYCYVDDCVTGLLRLAESAVDRPVNIGSEERVSIGNLVARIARVAGKEITPRYLPDKPVGPLGRVSDNALCRELLGWEPGTTLDEGLRHTYRWIEEQVAAERAGERVAR
ncbi:NAD-dependent epimerase/dehydratase family protein [Actinosynnema mirum]|uniref:NAD-dependent epimerase/dehydratase n=1 Tax=Actinosynnema mirum (strain ATCC 29888 / DSM 43827 / JCM 3225 / NBRC 14064 / NCIMB 13271 / NRRL B-12336 / IMRU 3971 / 101) TaxID=446462 RepID=C6WBZ5_ACTMD|nr:NAD-dependent epimerase/dehydratase family protein [Actinosynnema mirum]ACU37562.1 NAD-dependent epimerase/dehydratase [Actinosynnema mirum DSM 43827]